jgi:hypothetical protein
MYMHFVQMDIMNASLYVKKLPNLLLPCHHAYRKQNVELMLTGNRMLCGGKA